MFSDISAPRRPRHNIILVLIAICAIIEAICLLEDTGLFGNWGIRRTLLEYGAFWPSLLRDTLPMFAAQKWTMFVTYGFLHGGFLHLVFNMITLWVLGRIVLDRSGQVGFGLVYTASLLGGAGLYGLFHTGGWPMVGASGALFGLAGTIVLWIWRAQPNVSASLSATWRIFAFLIIYNVVMYLALAGGLAWEAHLGGFLAGWLVAWVFLED